MCILLWNLCSDREYEQLETEYMYTLIFMCGGKNKHNKAIKI